MGFSAGDEVIVPAFSFFATAEVVTLLGAKVIFCDIEDKFYNIDPKLIEAKITAKTKAIMPVGIIGQTADMDTINAIAKKHNLKVIEDAAQSFGATYKGTKSCNLSHVGATSFFPAKPLGCYGDGGAVFTNDDDLAYKMKLIREHGQKERYHHTSMGINGRLDTIQCAIIIEKMKIFEDEIIARQKVASIYTEALKDTVITPVIGANQRSAWAQYTIRYHERNKLKDFLTAEGIPTSIHYPTPIPKQPYYQENGYAKESYPVSDKISSEVISLPMHPYLEKNDQDRIISAVKKFFK